MKNIQPPAISGDRISELPEPILQHVISFLPQKTAVRTCVLSKSWRHLGPTRPKIYFYEGDFGGRNKKFMSVVENTLQRYDDQKLPIQEFILSMFGNDSSYNSWSLLNKWIVKLHMLKRLTLRFVYIEDETFEKIMSSCPLIEHLVLEVCYGLSTVKVNKARNLKHFCCDPWKRCVSIEIDDAPSLETIILQSWDHLHNKNYFFPCLKYLHLLEVHLTTELLNNLSSNNCPCLEVLKLSRCSGFTDEFKLSNHSIKCLIIIASDCPIEAVIDAANLLYFEYSCSYLPSMISFAPTSREWKSRLDVRCYSHSTWSIKLHEFLKALSQSQISLNTFPWSNQVTCDDNGCEPVAVENWYLGETYPSHKFPDLLNCMFRICRPRYIYVNKCRIQLAESIWKTLVNKGETGQCDFWHQDLEESSIQVTETKPKLFNKFTISRIREIRFRLKWRD